MFDFEKIKITDYKLSRFINYLRNVDSELFVNEEFLFCKGLCDVHVHFREPGFPNKETIKCGSLAAAHGGYTTVCTMPNVNPSPYTLNNLKIQLDIINKDSVIDIYPYGRITKDGEINSLSDMEDLENYVCAYSDDGKGVQTGDMMESAMLKAKSLNKMIVAHCEDNSLLKKGGCIHDGNWAKEHGFIGISSASEYKQIERDLELAKKTGAKYHVCHISTKESVDLIRQAKKDGIDVTCETAPHYLVLCDEDLKDEGRFKMNPPLRGKEDKEALIEGIIDGTIDMIATDHAPHTLEEKSQGLQNSPFGIVGIENSFAVLYTNLVKKGIISLEKLISLLTDNPRNRFNLPDNGFSIFDIKNKFTIDSNDFLSKGKSTPFDGKEVYGKCLLTVCNDKIVYYDKNFFDID